MIKLFTTSGLLGDWLLNSLNSIGVFIDWILYSFISWAYQVFIAISQVNLFGESTLRLIIDRVFTVLGIVMLFIMAYEIILLIINPDKLTGENGAKKLVTKVITSIILIVLLPTIYKYMQIFQYNVITSNVIGNIVLGGSTTTNVGEDIKMAGTNMALTLATTFYHPMSDGEEYTYTACLNEGQDIDVCKTYVKEYEDCRDENSAGALFINPKLGGLLQLNPWESFRNHDRSMKYIPILSSVAAILAIRMILAFCLDIGVRVAKLGFLQVIAPVPIAANIAEKNSIFESKWFKSLKDTYLDIFIKLFIIYFSMLAITLVPEVFSNMWASNGGFFIKSLANVIVILGILQFAKDGPKLIKELFNLDLDISIKKRLGENEYAMRGATSISGGVRGAVQGKVGGALLGAREGWKLGGDIKDPTKIRGAGRMAASEGMRTRQSMLDEKDKYKREGIKSYFGEKITDIKDDYKGKGTALFDQSLKGVSDVEKLRGGFSEELSKGTAVARAESSRDSLYTKISGETKDFIEEYEAVLNSNPEFRKNGFVFDEEGNIMYEDGRYITKDGVESNNGQFQFAEYVRNEKQKAIKELKTKELKDVFLDKTHTKHETINSQIESTIDRLKENKHILGKEIDQIVKDYNEAGQKRRDKLGVAYNEIKDGDLDTLQAELLKVENVDLTVEIMESKMRNTLSSAKGKFETARAQAAKDK
ncbi:MAG: hypothetical protein WC177_03410 [Bacilli bacterium]